MKRSDAGAAEWIEHRKIDVATLVRHDVWPCSVPRPAIDPTVPQKLIDDIGTVRRKGVKRRILFRNPDLVKSLRAFVLGGCSADLVRDYRAIYGEGVYTDFDDLVVAATIGNAPAVATVAENMAYARIALTN